MGAFLMRGSHWLIDLHVCSTFIRLFILILAAQIPQPSLFDEVASNLFSIVGCGDHAFAAGTPHPTLADDFALTSTVRQSFVPTIASLSAINVKDSD